MANKFIRYLTQGFVGGVTNPKGNMGNWQHATRLFVDDTYRLAPRTKFLYYVRFELDKTAITSPTFVNQHADEIGYLIKTTDFPKYNFDSVVKNQYNRKKLLYKNFNYEPINMVFHDDSKGIINALWAIYYGYYLADRTLPDAAYGATAYRGQDDPRSNFRYGFDNNKSVDIFKSITIYSMSQRRFNGYTLVNPRIKSWAHSQGDYSASEFMENSMTVEYEAVRYTTGKVGFDRPKGFATLHYDTTPSPLSVAGGGVANIIGEGGVLSGIEEIFGAVGSGEAFGSLGGFLGTVISGVNTVNNFNRIRSQGISNVLKREAVNILSSPATVRNAVSTVSGVIGAAFPRNSNNTSTTTATPKKLLGGD